MQFPEYQVPYVGNGTVIGVNAVVHVVLSHGIAIGAFAMLVLGDWFSSRAKAAAVDWDLFNRRMLKFVTLVITIVGGLTGVGIWFTTSALAPRGIGSMLRIFFWPWFVEWIVFVLEVVGVLIYYNLWERLNQRRPLRLLIGVAYLALACSSAFLITGILGFMLTPGDWPEKRDLFGAFFNPSFAPQLAWRLSLAFVIGALTALGFALLPRAGAEFQRQASCVFGGILGVSLVLLALTVLLYFRAVPITYTSQSRFAVLTGRLSQWPWTFYVFNIVTAGVLVVTAWAAVARWRSTVRALTFPALLAIVAVTAEIERIREFIRGPYLMPGYMYANGVLVHEKPWLDHNGVLATSFWFGEAYAPAGPHASGAFLFARNCSACHTIGGINDIQDRFHGRSEDGIYAILGHTDEMVPFMPPFSGTPEERAVLAKFLFDLGQKNVPLSSRARFIPSEAKRK